MTTRTRVTPVRCAHGFVDGMCVQRNCPHWDGARTALEESRTVFSHRGRGKQGLVRERGRRPSE